MKKELIVEIGVGLLFVLLVFLTGFYSGQQGTIITGDYLLLSHTTKGDCETYLYNLSLGETVFVNGQSITVLNVSFNPFTRSYELNFTVDHQQAHLALSQAVTLSDLTFNFVSLGGGYPSNVVVSLSITSCNPKPFVSLFNIVPSWTNFISFIPVFSRFTVQTETCRYIQLNGSTIPYVGNLNGNEFCTRIGYARCDTLTLQSGRTGTCTDLLSCNRARGSPFCWAIVTPITFRGNDVIRCCGTRIPPSTELPPDTFPRSSFGVGLR